MVKAVAKARDTSAARLPFWSYRHEGGIYGRK